MKIDVRAARPGEEAAVLGLYEWLFAPPGSKPAAWDERRATLALRDAIESHDACVLVAEITNVPPASSASPPRAAGSAEGRRVGLCTVYQDLHSVRFGYRAWIEDLAVHPEQRSLGIGKALLDAAKDWARKRGATHLELDSGEARTEAHRFYERENPSWRSLCFAWEL